MYARVATFDYSGNDPEDVRREFEEISRRAAAGLPEDLPAVELLDLYNAGDGKVLSITLFRDRGGSSQGRRDPELDEPAGLGRGRSARLRRDA